VLEDRFAPAIDLVTSPLDNVPGDTPIPGSLRQVIHDAHNGDTINFSIKRVSRNWPSRPFAGSLPCRP
jgi:hypothetical protein